MLLLEAGPRDWHPFIHMPAGLAKLVGKKGINWDYYTEPEAQPRQPPPVVAARTRARRLEFDQCDVLHPRRAGDDYDDWARAAGDERWNWQNVLPYFKRAEGNTRGADELHGGDGPLGVQDLRYHNPLSQAFVDAALACGHPANRDFNGAQQEGFGLYQVTQTQRRALFDRGRLSARRARPQRTCSVRTGADDPARAVRRRARHRRRLSPSRPPDRAPRRAK